MERDSSYLVGNQFAKGQKPNQTAFKKGQIPWNKGMKGLRLSPDSEFKKGRFSETKCEIGTIRTRKSKKGKLRNFIKTGQPRQWIEFAKHLWIQHYGKLLPGDITHHLNGISTDDRIENIIAMPRQHHPCFHGRWGLRELSIQQIEYYKSRY